MYSNNQTDHKWDEFDQLETSEEYINADDEISVHTIEVSQSAKKFENVLETENPRNVHHINVVKYHANHQEKTIHRILKDEKNVLRSEH